MENVNIETLRVLSTEIIQEESKNLNISIDFYPITTKEYYKKFLLNRKNKNQGLLDRLTTPFKHGGFNDQKGKIIIFLDKIDKFSSDERKIFATILYSYHEIQHTKQKLLDDYSYPKFIYDIENYLVGERKINYKKNHNKVLFEIDANLYSITKTKEYLQSKYPDVYEKVSEELLRLEQEYAKDYQEYNPISLVEQIIDYMHHQLKVHFAEYVGHMEIISPVLELFLYPDLQFISLKSIMKNEKTKNLDKRIIYIFLSTRQFLETIDIDKLNRTELMLLKNALEYTNQKELKEYKTNITKRLIKEENYYKSINNNQINTRNK